jgi:hypothetical protein
MMVMSMRTAELVSDWETVSFEGGYDGLHSLSDREFSGAVIAGSARLFMLRGTVVGILDGDIEQFENSDGTARKAPHDALPLLTVMQARAGESRAQYYTEDTPLSEVDGTLSDGRFTGFIELSENVLSGDYYLVYHQGRSMTVAWTGSSQRLVTDEDAFEQANDEVGIYDVFAVDIEPIELPEREDTGSDELDTSANTASETDISDLTSDTGRVDTSQPDTASEDGRAAETASDADGSTDGSNQTDDTATSKQEADWFETDPDGSEASSANAEQLSSTQSETDTQSHAAVDEPEDGSAGDIVETQETDAETGVQTPDQGMQEPDTLAQTDAAGDPPEPDQADQQLTPEPDPGSEKASATAPEDDYTPTATTSEIKSIPSLDPDRSQPKQSGTIPTATRAHPESESESDTSVSSELSDGQTQSSELRSELAERENDVQRLQTELNDLTAENEDLKAERDRLREELSEARSEIQRLQTELDAVDIPTDDSTDGVELSVTEAIDGTNLFVRYRSKSGATLKKAADESADRSSVEENIRLEHHTQFEDESATVDGQDFEVFLTSTIHYQFVKWLVQNLLYEIRDTGNASSMSDLYDALPNIDRAELNGQVSITYTEDGEQHRTQEQFDVVVRDRMGNPLMLANINDSRQPATGGQMQNIVRDAEHVGNTSESLAAAFLVTNSFFEPEALETAEEATSSGLLSRDKGKSFVNLSRKDGYHLCLLEARNDEFHLSVPEL